MPTHTSRRSRLRLRTVRTDCTCGPLPHISAEEMSVRATRRCLLHAVGYCTYRCRVLYVQGAVRTGGVGQLAPRRHAPHVYHAPYTYQHVHLPRVPRTVHLPVCTLTTYTTHCTLTLQRHALDTYQFVHLPVCYAYQYVRTTLITCTTHCTLTSMYTVRRTRTRLVACMRMYRMYLG